MQQADLLITGKGRLLYVAEGQRVWSCWECAGLDDEHDDEHDDDEDD